MRKPVMYRGAVVLTVLVLLSACALFQNDPVGATLLTIKDGYEASVRTAGRLYINRIIDEPQLRRFRDAANKFFLTYNTVVAAHEARRIEPGDARIDQLRIAGDNLEALVSSFAAKKGI